MYYKEFLRARNAVFSYALVWAILFVVSSILMIWLPMSSDAHAHNAPGLQPQPWPALLAVASFSAAIIATVLGSTLSQENDGHLELVLTKPYGRVAYATTAIAIDSAAILISVLVGFVFIWFHYLIFHHSTTPMWQGYRLVAGPDPVFNVLRFAFFPLAWYALIAGTTAGLRGKAGVVQALIWPVTLILAALREIPATGGWLAWHNLFAVINLFNPLIYASYQDQTSGVQLVSASVVPGVMSTAILAAYVVAGWAAAAMQWRRVEA